MFRFGEISLVPLQEMPDSVERDEYLELTKDLSILTPPVSYAAFTLDREIPRIANRGTTLDEIKVEVFNELQEIAMLTNGIDQLSCLPHWQCIYSSPDTPFGPWEHWTKTIDMVDIVGTHDGKFDDSEAESLGKMLQNFKANVTDDKKKAWLSTILERIQKSKRQRHIEGQILDLSIAAEMLLLRKLGKDSPISLPFRLRGSWLLGTNYESRQKIYDALKEFYGYRCSIAHEGGFTKEKEKIKASGMLPEFYSLVEQILLLSLDPSFPDNQSDWDKLLLGEISESNAPTD